MKFESQPPARSGRGANRHQAMDVTFGTKAGHAPSAPIVKANPASGLAQRRRRPAASSDRSPDEIGGSE